MSPSCLEAEASLSGTELLKLLVRAGGQVVDQDDHGGFVRIDRRLVFVPFDKPLRLREVRDVRRLCEMGPGRFDRLLAEVRTQPGTPRGA